MIGLIASVMFCRGQVSAIWPLDSKAIGKHTNNVSCVCCSILPEIVHHFLQKLNPIQDLQVIEILLKFCSCLSDDAVRHSVFKSLFERVNDNEHHISLLSKLISMAVGVKNVNTLNSAAIWMQVCLNLFIVVGKIKCNDDSKEVNI